MVEYQQQQQQTQQTHHENPAGAPYQLVQLIEAQPHQHGDDPTPCTKSHEPHQETSIAGAVDQAQGDYPAEIVYLSQNGEVVAPPQSQQQVLELGPTPIGDTRESSGQQPGVAATILTEVPVRDMPLEGKQEAKVCQALSAQTNSKINSLPSSSFNYFSA